MADSHHENNKPVVFDLIYDSIVAYPRAKKAIWSGKHFYAGGAGFFCQRQNLRVHSLENGPRERTEVATRRRGEFDFVVSHLYGERLNVPPSFTSEKNVS